jgi:hypothetical protein
MSVRSERRRRDGENGHEEEMKKREKEIDERRKDQRTKCENPIFRQKLVSIEYGSTSSWEIHHFPVKVGCQGTCSICMIWDCCVAVSARQLSLLLVKFHTDVSSTGSSSFAEGRRWGRLERGVDGLTQRTLLVKRRSTQIQIRMATRQLCVPRRIWACVTLSRILDIYISALALQAWDELTLYSKFWAATMGLNRYFPNVPSSSVPFLPKLEPIRREALTGISKDLSTCSADIWMFLKALVELSISLRDSTHQVAYLVNTSSSRFGTYIK